MLHNWTIHKYNISPLGPTKLQLPHGSKVLSFQYQPHNMPTNGFLVIWVWQPTNLRDGMSRHTFGVYITGDTTPHPSVSTYIGTTQQGPHVAHLFELF